MAITNLFVWVLRSVFANVLIVSDELDEPTRECMHQRLEMLIEDTDRLLQKLDQMIHKQKRATWRALLFAALRHWQFWAIAGILILLIVGLCWCFRKRSHEAGSSREEEEDSEGEDAAEATDLGTYIAMRNKWSADELWNRSELVHALVESLLIACQWSNSVSNGFFPELGPAIGVGSAFDYWSSREDEPVYCQLVRLKPPRGHAFCLEPHIVAKESRIRVELQCTCTTQETVGPMLCFLHDPEEELRKKQKPSLLHTLCTGSYLDVQKTACWLQDLVSESTASMRLLRLRYYVLTVLPSSRSCKVQIRDVFGRTMLVEMMFGMQLGDSDIFMSSQPTEDIFTPSTMWTLSCTWAEAKFLWLMFDQTPDDSLLSCLQLCTRMVAGTGFSSYTLKTVVMHLLTTTPLSGWRRRHFLLRLDDIMRYLRCCLEEKRLNHFFFGNEKIPEEIVVPPALQRAEPLNLFQHLVQDPAAHEQHLPLLWATCSSASPPPEERASSLYVT
uniref:Mab-21-like HhH/H2TH-like domain-containing protein n=1 Tax=Strigops habroptila TaxID=2489341 RepID=A0A672TW16_STRHB